MNEKNKMIASIILPVYNEADIISKTFDSVLAFSKSNNYEFIFVNDGSTDNSEEILNNKILKADTSRIRLISYSANRGKGYAIKVGVADARTKKICFIDSDLAYSLDHIPEMLKKLDKFDFVIGRRGLVEGNVDHIKPARKLTGRVFNRLARIILGLDTEDTQAGLKGFKADVARELFKRQRIERFAFDVELIYLAKKLGYTMGEIPARLSEEHSDKHSKVNILKDSIRMFSSLIAIRINDSLGKYK